MDVSDLVTLNCDNHHQRLVDVLWRFLRASYGLDVDVEWGGRSLRAHRLILDVFLSPDKLLGSGAGRQPSRLRQGGQDDSVLDALLHFLYQGTVTVRKDQLECLMDLAKESDFHALEQALESAIKEDRSSHKIQPTTCRPFHDPLEQSSMQVTNYGDPVSRAVTTDSGSQARRSNQSNSDNGSCAVVEVSGMVKGKKKKRKKRKRSQISKCLPDTERDSLGTNSSPCENHLARPHLRDLPAKKLKAKRNALGEVSQATPGQVKLTKKATKSVQKTTGKLHCCKICGETFCGPNKLKRHLLLHANEHQCEQCDASFQRAKLLRLHRHVHDLDTLQPDELERHSISNLRESMLQDPDVGILLESDTEVVVVPQSEGSIERMEGSGCYGSNPADCQSESHLRQSVLRDKLNTSLTCQVGDESISKKRRVLHQQPNVTGNAFRCADCGKEFFSKKRLVAHTKEHVIVDVAEPALIELENNQGDVQVTSFHTCPVCSFGSSKKKILAKHMVKNHPDDAPTVIAVDAQPEPTRSDKFEMSTSSANLVAHNQVPELQMKDRNATLKCKWCEYQTHKPNLLKRHRRLTHRKPDQVAEVQPQPENVIETRPAGQELCRRYCHLCSHVCHRLDELSDHLHRVHDTRLYVCTWCPFAAVDEEDVQRHADQFHSEYGWRESRYPVKLPASGWGKPRASRMAVGDEGELRDHSIRKRAYVQQSCPVTGCPAKPANLLSHLTKSRFHGFTREYVEANFRFSAPYQVRRMSVCCLCGHRARGLRRHAISNHNLAPGTPEHKNLLRNSLLP